MFREHLTRTGVLIGLSTYVPPSELSDTSSRIQERLADILQNPGCKICVPNYNAHGDSYLMRWAHYAVISDFASAKGLPFDSTKLTSQPPSESEGRHLLNPTNNLPYTIPIDYSPDLEHINTQCLMRVATTIGYYNFDPGIFLITPQPIKSDLGPLSNYDVDQVARVASELKYDGERIVIVQTGSHNAKRFSDANVLAIAQQYKQAHPGKKITLLSDKPSLLSRLEGKNTGGPFVLEDIFPIDNPEFISEVRSHWGLNDCLKSAVDEIYFYEQDISRTCGYLVAADRVITTDSFLAHLAGGVISTIRHSYPTNLTVLHTTASRKSWGVIGARTIDSLRIDRRNRGIQDYSSFIPSEDVAMAVSVSMTD